MPESYVVMWTLERCRWLQRVGDHGPLEVIFGGPHISMPSVNAIHVGDFIYPVCIKDGGLYIVAGMRVRALVPPEEYIREHLGIVLPPVKMWDQLFHELKNTQPSFGHRLPTTCADLAAIGESGSEIRFDRRTPDSDLPLLRLGPKPGREQPITGIKDGQLKTNFSFQGYVRRLSAQSADIFTRVL